MNANELADYLDENVEAEFACEQVHIDEAVIMLRQLQYQNDKYKQVLESIANERVELSHDKIKWQCEDHIKWAKDVLK
mgnify:CR=1 FL=1